MTPPAKGPSWRRGALPGLAAVRDFDRHLSVGRRRYLHAGRPILETKAPPIKFDRF